MEGISPNSCTRQQVLQEKKTRPQEQLNCPRCNSTNTKFCYYNNYSLTQPRYFCKTCRRYWTEGGSLRNVPVGGGSRKNKKIINSSSSSTTPAVLAPTSVVPPTIANSSKVIPDLNPPTIPHHHQNPNKMMQGGGQDLNLAFPSSMDQKYHHHHQGLPPYLEIMPNNGDNSTHHHPNSLSALDLLRSRMVSTGLGPYASNSLIQNSSSPIYPSRFPMQEVKPTNGLGFSMDHHHHGVGNRSSYDNHEVLENNNNIGGGRVLFPFGEVKQHSSQGDEVGNNDDSNNKEQGNSSTGYWSGMIGEGSW